MSDSAVFSHVHLEPVGGVAGDMFVAAMLDLFPQLNSACWRDLQDSGVMQHVQVRLETGSSKGVSVKRLQVALSEKPAKRTGNYRDLRRWLNDSALETGVKVRAQSILKILAEAEAQVHGVDLEAVHFHEVADWDSIVDVVAAASLIERAQISRWSCGSLPLGSGLVKTEHGMLPVPAPATAWLLKGLSVWDDGESGERVTPTGAAIVRHILSTAGNEQQHTRRPEGVLSAVGSGAGTRELQQRPNVLRCLLIERQAAQFSASDSTRQFSSSTSSAQSGDTLQAANHQIVDEVVQISFDIDDMTPEELSISLDHVRHHSAVLDARFVLGMGKKARALFAVTVLCHVSEEAAVSALCFEETSTLGMRVQRLQRRTLKRQQKTVSVSLGADAREQQASARKGSVLQTCIDGSEVSQVELAAAPGTPSAAGIKRVTRPSGGSTVKVESDDLAAIPGLQARRKQAQKLREPYES